MLYSGLAEYPGAVGLGVPVVSGEFGELGEFVFVLGGGVVSGTGGCVVKGALGGAVVPGLVAFVIGTGPFVLFVDEVPFPALGVGVDVVGVGDMTKFVPPPPPPLLPPFPHRQ